MYVDEAYYYRPGGMVSQSVFHGRSRAENGRTDWHAFLVEDSGGSKEPCKWGKGELRPVVKYGDALPWAVQKRDWTYRDAVWDLYSVGPKEACVTWGCTVTHPGEYHWTVHVWRLPLLPPCPFTFSSFAFFTFPIFLFSFALPIFFFHPFPFSTRVVPLSF